MTEEQIKEIEVRRASIFGPDAAAGQRAMEELCAIDVHALVAEIRRLRDSAAAQQAYHRSELPPHLREAISDARMDPRHDHLRCIDGRQVTGGA